MKERGEAGRKEGERKVRTETQNSEVSCVCMCSYQLAESVDRQLRRMEQDLKEIIEQMNSSNAAEDEDSPVHDEHISLSHSLSLHLSVSTCSSPPISLSLFLSHTHSLLLLPSVSPPSSSDDISLTHSHTCTCTNAYI